MRNMKDSGIEWIGKIPEDWDVIKTKNRYSSNKEIVGNMVDKFDRLALTLNGVIKRGKDDSEGLQPEKFEGYQILRENELVFKLIDLENIRTSRVGLSSYTGIVSPAYIVLNNEYESKFGYYYFLSMWQREIFNKLGGDGVRSNLNTRDLLNIPYINIPMEEQREITEYLDLKVSQIDNIISKTKETVEEYKKYKQSVITEAVTKGLNPNVEMKDSGIEWIGEIPKHWNIIRLRFLCDICTGNKDTVNKEDDGIYPFYVRSPKVEKINSYSFDGEAILTAGDGVGAGKVFHYVNEKFDYHQRVYNLHNFSKNIKPKLLYYYLKENFYKEIEKGNAKSTVDSIRLNMLQNFPVIIPNKEQEDIVKYLDKKVSEIDKLISKKQNLITELEQYKKSLIYECVTGKKEVSVSYAD